MKKGNSSNKILFLFRENYKLQYKSVRDRRTLLRGWMRYVSAAVRGIKIKKKKKSEGSLLNAFFNFSVNGLWNALHSEEVKPSRSPPPEEARTENKTAQSPVTARKAMKSQHSCRSGISNKKIKNKKPLELELHWRLVDGACAAPAA